MRWPMRIALYDCGRIRDMLYDALEGTLAPVVKLRFRLHLANCAPCREYLKLYNQAANVRAFRRDNPPPTELMDKTLAFLEGEGLIEPEEGKPPADGDGGSGRA
jgi:hypothetical protein